MAIADAFEKGLYWAFYHYLEDDLIEYMRKVPYIDEHKHVHSPALLAQLLLNCSYIDTAFKDMARYAGFTGDPACQRIINGRRKYNIGYAHEAFEPIYKLPAKKVIAKLDWCGDRELIPFEEFDKTSGFVPKWWTAYNNSKHNWTRAFEQANLSNALASLGGAFLLNAIHFSSIEFLHSIGNYEFGVWQKSGFFPTNMIGNAFKEMLNRAVAGRRDLEMDSMLETKLFIYANKRT